jgi:hypothetical protein
MLDELHNAEPLTRACGHNDGRVFDRLTSAERPKRTPDLNRQQVGNGGMDGDETMRSKAGLAPSRSHRGQSHRDCERTTSCPPSRSAVRLDINNGEPSIGATQHAAAFLLSLRRPGSYGFGP